VGYGVALQNHRLGSNKFADANTYPVAINRILEARERRLSKVVS